jgi:hypothetical protein
MHIHLLTISALASGCLNGSNKPPYFLNVPPQGSVNVPSWFSMKWDPGALFSEICWKAAPRASITRSSL